MSEFEEGWYEFTSVNNATTHIAYVQENGDVYTPDSTDIDWEHAARRERLIRPDELESALASERAAREAGVAGEPIHGSMIVEYADFDEAVNAERRRQKTLGYTNEHDDEHGVEHLLNWAYDYVKRGKWVKAGALIRAARATFMRGQKRALAAEATIAQAPHDSACPTNWSQPCPCDSRCWKFDADLSALARHDAEVWDQGWKRGVIESSTGYSKYETGDNPYRKEATE